MFEQKEREHANDHADWREYLSGRAMQPLADHDLSSLPGAIQVQASIEIAALPERAAALYRAVDQWGKTFPATIESARVVETGEGWQQIEVAHKSEGRVPNILENLSQTEIRLWERKKLYDASFLNRFEAAAEGGTHYTVRADIYLKGIARVFKPVLGGYVRKRARRQIQEYVLIPVKRAVEQAQ